MHYVGVDYHKRSSFVTVIDEQGRAVKQANLANTKEAVAAFLDGMTEDMAAVLEAGTEPLRAPGGRSLPEPRIRHTAPQRVASRAVNRGDRGSQASKQSCQRCPITI